VALTPNTHLVALPRDFVSACVGLSGEAGLLLVHYFSICSSAKDSVAYVETGKAAGKLLEMAWQSETKG